MTLRPGVKFNDGSDLTSTVVQEQLQRSGCVSPDRHRAKAITSVDTPDAMTVVYNLSAPRPSFPPGSTTQVGLRGGPGHVDQAAAGNSTPNPIGTGPFIYSRGSPTTTSPPPGTPTTGGPGYRISTRSPSSPFPTTPTGVHPPDRWRRPDRVTSDPVTIKDFVGSGSQYQLVDSLTGVIGEPTCGLHHAEHGGGPHQRPPYPPGVGQRAQQSSRSSRSSVAASPSPSTGCTRRVRRTTAVTPAIRPSTSPAPRALVNQYKAEHGTPSLTLSTVTDPRLEQVVQIVQQMWQPGGVRRHRQRHPAGHPHRRLHHRQVPGGHVLPVRRGRPRPQLRLVEHHHGLAGRGHRPQLPPQLRPPDRVSLQSGRHPPPGHPVKWPTRSVNQRLANDLPYLWLEQYPFSRWRRTHPEFRQPDAAQRDAGLRLRRGHLLPHPDLAERIAGRAARLPVPTPHGQVLHPPIPPAGGGGVHHLGALLHAGPPASRRPVGDHPRGPTTPPTTGPSCSRSWVSTNPSISSTSPG